MLERLFFYALFGLFFYLIRRRILYIRRCIRQGRTYAPNTTRRQRWRQMIRTALGQSKMFHQWIPALLHMLIYAGFLIINIEIIEIFLDGVLGRHRILLPFLGTYYAPFISTLECLAVAVLVACIAFWVRRDVFRVRRLNEAELSGRPIWDARLILLFEMILMSAFLVMNTTDLILQERTTDYSFTGPFVISQYLRPLFSPYATDALQWIERTAWWLHWMGVLGFALYVTYSKHLHIVLAFPAAYYRRARQAHGQPTLSLMADIYAEVRTQLGLAADASNPSPSSADANPTEPAPSFGAKKVSDLNWKNILDAYACSECGRCSAHCPATQTGKKLSPRRIMMQVRRAASEAQQTPSQAKKTLLYEYISPEEVLACTTCQACQMACPLELDPLDIIMSMRRYLMMETQDVPSAWTHMIANVEQSASPWRFDAARRMEWIWEKPDGSKK